MESDKKLDLDFRCKKLEIKQKYVSIFMTGLTITFTINLGLFSFLWIVVSSTKPDYSMGLIIIILGLMLNVIGLIAYLCVGNEFDRELCSIKIHDDIKMRKKILILFCSIGFGMLILVWIFLSYTTHQAYFKSKVGTQISTNQLTITTSGLVTISTTGQVTIASTNPVNTTTIGTGNTSP